MRTMLISLVFVLSLSQLAIAENEIKGSDYECGVSYECYAPEVCTKSTLFGQTVDQGIVVKVEGTDEISKDCPALFRFHQYTSTTVLVETQSFQKKDIVESIEFTQKDDNTQLTKNVISCSIDSNKNKMLGKYNGALRYEEDAKPEKLICSLIAKFTPTSSGRTNFFAGSPSDVVIIKINTDTTAKETKKAFLRIPDNERCDPDLLYFPADEVDEFKLHQKLEYKAGKSSCKTDLTHPTVIPQPEYLKADGNWEGFQGSIVCNPQRRYVINGKELPFDKLVKIRCSADVEYFCDYEVKWDQKEGKKPKSQMPNFPTKAVLECPTETSHLIIGDAVEPILHAKFVCKHLGGGKPFWTVNNDILTADGSAVHCTNKLPCLNPVPESAVSEGFVDGELRPQCFAGGTMKVSGKEVNQTEFQCNTTTGEYAYKFTEKDGGIESTVKKETTFDCTYPEVDSKALDTANRKTILEGGIVAGAVSGAIILVIFVLVFFVYVPRKVAKDKKKAAAEAKKVYMLYCADEQQEAAAKRRKQEGQKSEMSARADWSSWNTLVMNAQYKSLALFKNGSGEETKTDRLDSPAFTESDKVQFLNETQTLIWVKVKTTEIGKTSMANRQREAFQERLDAAKPSDGEKKKIVVVMNAPKKNLYTD